MGCIYLHDDSVPNMARPRCCYFKKERRKKSGRQRERMREGMRLLHSRGHEARQCSPGYPSCQILLSPPLLRSTPQTAFPCNRREGRSFYRKQKAGACVLNPSAKGRPLSFPRCRRAEGASASRYCNRQPRSPETIAELMHTRDDVRTLQRLTAANPEARRGLGHRTATRMATPLSQGAEDKEPDTYFPL